MATINSGSLLGAGLSLVNYMGTSNTGFTGTGVQTGGKNAGSGTTLTSGSGDVISLSPQAQALLAKAKTSATPASSGTGSEKTLNAAQKNAQSFIAGFFDDHAIDISKASSETISLFQGLSEIINDMSDPTTNTAIDKGMRKASQGQRVGITLQEDGHTVSFIIKYKDGKPASMTVTNVTGQTAETAVISLGADASGKPSAVHVTSEKNTYNRFGGKTSGVVRDAIDFDLYKS